MKEEPLRMSAGNRVTVKKNIFLPYYSYRLDFFRTCLTVVFEIRIRILKYTHEARMSVKRLSFTIPLL